MEVNNTRKLYDALKSDGYTDLGDFSSFEGKLKDSGKREMLYDVLKKDGWQDLGDFSQFESKLGYAPINNENIKETDYVSQSSVNPPPISLRQEVDIPKSDQSEYVNPWDNSADYNFESLRKKGKIETATPPPPTEYEKDSSFMNTWAGDAIQKLNAGGADLGAGIFGVLDKVSKGLVSATGGLIPRGGAFKDISDRFKADAEFSRARSNRYNGKDFTDLWKEGNYMGAIGDIALQGVESLPMSIGAMAATMAGAPAAGLAGIGSIVASQKYDDLDQNNPNMGEFAKVSNAILTGTAESLSEMLGAGVSKAWMSTLFKTLGKEKAQEAIKRGIMGKMQEFYKKFGMFFEPVNEGIEEVSSTLAENITDKITGADPERDLTDGVLQSFVYGMGGGAYFTGAGALAKGAQYVADKIGGKQAQQPITDSNVTDQGVETPPLLTKSRFAEAEEEGRNMTDPGDIRTASKKMEETRLSLSGMVPGLASTIESYVDDKASEAQVMSLLDGVNADARPLAEDFYADYLRISGLQDRIGEEIDNEVETYVANNITPYVTTNPDGQSIVTTATLSEGNEERPVYVRSIEGDKAVISDNGQDRMVSVKRLSDIVEQDAGHMRRTYEDQLLATRQSELDMTMHHNPKTQLPKPGLIIWNGDNAFILQGQDENGDWIAQPAAYDRETGQVTAKNGSSPAMPITENEILDLQDAIYDAQQVNVMSPEDDNVASADAEITSAPPMEDAINQPTSEIETEGAIDQIAQPSNVENPSMVMREDGTPDFVSSGTDMALDFLYDKYGDKMPRKIEVTRKSFDESLKKASDALEKAQEAYDDAPIGKEDKAEAALIKARQEYEAIKVEADFWANLDDDIKEASKKPGDVIAKEISVIGDPMSGEELAAMMLANGAIKLTRDSYKKETGAGNNETARMFGLFASPEKGGVNIERAGEILELADRENGTNFFDENDTNAGRDAIIEVLSSARTRGDLIDYVKRNREAIAERERQAEYNAYAEWCEENYHMSPEEYEAYEESMARDFSEKQLTDEERGELDSQIVDEIQAIIDEQNEIDAILAQNKPIENENIEGNDESGGDGLREGGGEVLPREQLDQTGGTGEVEGRESAGPDIDRTDGATQEGSSRGLVPFVAPSPKENETPLDYAERIVEAKRLHEEELKVDTNPTEAQKEAGNYKKGHIKINGFDVTIEQPAGSVRSGKDANGKEWSVTMNNTYGYIRGTESVDGDHIDVFLGPDMNSDMVYVVDQVNTDGSFDEHKVMMGFSSLEDARSAYLSNYEEGWQGLGNITGVALDGFKKWIDSSTRKTKPFYEYKGIKQEEGDISKNNDSDNYSIVPSQYTTKKGKVLDMRLLKFGNELSKEQQRAAKELAKAEKGWYDRLRIKQNFINQMMKGDISSRVMEEQDDSDPSGMTFSEMAATLSGDKTAQLLFVAQNKLKKLQNSKRSDLNSKSSMRDSIYNSKLRIQEYNSRKDIMERNANIVKENFPDGVESVTVKGNTFSDGISNELTSIIDDYYDRYTLDRNTPPLKISLNGGKGEAIVHFNEGMMVYSLYLGKEKLVENRDFSGGKGLMASIDRQLGIPAKSVSDIAAKIKAEENKIAGLEEAVKKPWGKEDELNAAQAEVNDLQRQLVEKAKAEDIQLESTLDVDGTLVKEEGETRFRFMGVDTTNNQDNVSSIESSINDWSNMLNTPVRVIHDVDDINDTDENMLARKRDSKGWYDTSTGEIVIVSPNSTSVGDAQRTFLHEVVGHHGLRELFGDDFDTFLDNVYRNANVDIRKNIIDRTKGNPLNLREATEEYIAELAERGFDNKAERSLWEKIKDSFLDMLRKAGISLDFKLSDNDLRYILWRSYKNLEQGNLMDVAEDIVMRNRLGLNNINLNENGSIERDIEPEKGKQPSETKGTGRELETIEGVDENGNESERDHIDKPRGVENSIDGTENATDRNGRETDGQVDNDGDQLDGGDTGDRNGSVRDGIDGERTVIGRAGSENKGRGVGESVREKTDDFAFADKTIRFRENARNESVLFADNDIQVVEKQVGSAKDQYERTLSTSSYQFQEAFQDSMLGLKTLQDAVAKATRSRILDYENAYMAENALSSVNKAEFNAYRKAAFEPILKAMSRLEKMGSTIDEIRDYLITKHGIERNREMAVKRVLSQNSETYKSLLDEYIGRRNEIRENGRSWEEQQSEMDRLAEEYGANLSDDFSGFTSMYPNEDNTGYDPDSARRYVLDYESRYDTSELSASVKRATDAILAKQRDSGLMSQNTFDSISDMYQFYVPLRGWEETTADEVYAYLTSESQTFNAPIKTVVGRKSKADDPIATIANMAESGIMQGNRNLMKQKFLTMVQNHKTDLVSVSEMWVRLDEASGEWIAVFPDIPSNANPEQVESIVESFNKRMEELSNEKGSNVRRSRDAIGIPYKILPKDLKEHQVIVKRAGKEYVLTINGNPRAAQALNGLTNPDNTKGWFGTVERYAGWLNRNLAANFTTRNPNFMVSNFLRDALYSNTTVWVKESPVYAWKFNKNFAMVNPINMYRLVKGYENGTLDMSDPLNKAYHDFVMRGGETGYTNLRDVEAKKKAIQKELQYSKQKVSIGKALKILGEWMDLFNKSVENCARFAAFLTSREMGRSMDKSIYDAKEISVNFNKKGAGSKFLNTEGQTKIGNASAFTSGLSRSMYVFWNAGVQGMYNFGRLAKDNPKKFLGLASSFYLLGTIMPMLAAAFGDDEDDDYYDLPEYVRRNNICFRNGGGNWITIPMPIELRAIYGLGEMSSGIVSGKEKYTDKKMAMKIAEQMSQVLPLDMMEGGGGFSAFVPSSVKPLIEAGDNKDWTGLPLYKDNDFNKGMPEWTKAFKSVGPAILAMTKYANELTGGDKYTTGTVNLNPAIIEHILDGYFGGIEATRSQMVKSAETAWGSRDFDWRNIPVGNRLIKSGDERTRKKAIDNAYYENLEEMEKIGQRLRGYRKELSNPQNDSFDMAEYQKKLNDLMMSDEYRRYIEFNNLNKLYQSMGEYLKKVDDERLEMELYDLKAMMNEIANGK